MTDNYYPVNDDAPDLSHSDDEHPKHSANANSTQKPLETVLTSEAESLILAYRLWTNLDSLICDRTVKLKTYTDCFIASECVSWLCATRIMKSRSEAVSAMMGLLRS